MKKVLITTNIILFICLIGALTFIFVNYEKIFNETNDVYNETSDNIAFPISRGDFDFVNGDFVNGYPVRKQDNDENYFEDNSLIMSPEMAIAIYRAIVLYSYSNSGWKFEKPQLTSDYASDGINRSYIIFSVVHSDDFGGSDYLYRCEISIKDGSIVEAGFYYPAVKDD